MQSEEQIEAAARVIDPEAFAILDGGDQWRIINSHYRRVAAKGTAKAVLEAALSTPAKTPSEDNRNKARSAVVSVYHALDCVGMPVPFLYAFADAAVDAVSTDAEPVKTAPSAAVKELRWKGPDSSGEYHSLEGLWGYIIRAESVGGFWLTEIGRYFRSPKAAQAAAQADYETRIRSALSAQVQDVAGHEPYGTPGAGAMRVIDADQWEPCSPSYLSRGGCCATAPRVWNAEGLNHWHPKIPASPASKHGDAE